MSNFDDDYSFDSGMRRRQHEMIGSGIYGSGNSSDSLLKQRNVDLGDGNKYRLLNDENEPGSIVQAERVPTSEEMINKWWQDIYERSEGKEIQKTALFDLAERLSNVEFDLREMISRLERKVEVIADKPSINQYDARDEEYEETENYSGGQLG